MMIFNTTSHAVPFSDVISSYVDLYFLISGDSDWFL